MSAPHQTKRAASPSPDGRGTQSKRPRAQSSAGDDGEDVMQDVNPQDPDDSDLPVNASSGPNFSPAPAGHQGSVQSSVLDPDDPLTGLLTFITSDQPSPPAPSPNSINPVLPTSQPPSQPSSQPSSQPLPQITNSGLPSGASPRHTALSRVASSSSSPLTKLIKAYLPKSQGTSKGASDGSARGSQGNQPANAQSKSSGSGGGSDSSDTDDDGSGRRGGGKPPRDGDDADLNSIRYPKLRPCLVDNRPSMVRPLRLRPVIQTAGYDPKYAMTAEQFKQGMPLLPRLNPSFYAVPPSQYVETQPTAMSSDMIAKDKSNWRLQGSTIAALDKYANLDYLTAILGLENSYQALTLLQRDSKL